MWGRMKRRLWQRTSVTQNLSANLIGKILSVLVSLGCVPIYVQVLGIDGYGLIGIWTALEALASLLDAGITPTMARELAISATRPEGVQDTRDLVRTLEIGYWAIGIAIGGAIILGATSVASYWLKSNHSSPGEIRGIVMLIGVLIFCRWPLTFYSGGLSGLERQVLLSWATLAFTCMRSLGAVLVILFISPTVLAFFVWQIGINIAQLAIFAALLWRCMPSGSMPRLRMAPILRVWRFAGAVTGSTLFALLFTDLDKLLMSGMSSLEDFGYYSLSSRIAGILYMPASAIFAAISPALTRHASGQNERELASLYHRGSQVMSALILPPTVTVIFFAKPLIFAWTGNPAIADHAWLTTALLITAAAFMCLRFIPGALQFACGWISIGFWTNVVAGIVMIPLLIGLTGHFGGVGAATACLLVSAAYLAAQIPIMHRRLLRHEGWRWGLNDIVVPLIACSVTAALFAEVTGSPTTRLDAALSAISAGIIVGVAGLLATPLARKQLQEQLLRKVVIWRRSGSMREPFETSRLGDND